MAGSCTSEEYYALQEYIHENRERLMRYLSDLEPYQQMGLEARFSIYPELVNLSEMQDKLEQREVIPV